MIYSIFNSESQTEIQIDETLCENTLIQIITPTGSESHYLNPNDLSDFIGALLHIQSKKRRTKSH